MVLFEKRIKVETLGNNCRRIEVKNVVKEDYDEILSELHLSTSELC